MSLDLWSPALVPAERPYYRTDDDTAYCTSLLWLDPRSESPSASLSCTLDADHLHDPYDAHHGCGVTRWTDADAAAALADFGPRPTAGPLCTDCGIRPAAGLCGVCRAAVERDENREVIEA